MHRRRKLENEVETRETSDDAYAIVNPFSFFMFEFCYFEHISFDDVAEKESSIL
jgi:hypothetical protein